MPRTVQKDKTLMDVIKNKKRRNAATNSGGRGKASALTTGGKNDNSVSLSGGKGSSTVVTDTGDSGSKNNGGTILNGDIAR